MLDEREDSGDQLSSSSIREFGTAKPVKGVNRRRDLRYPSHVPVEIRIFPSDGSAVPAILVDISLSGLQLELDATVPKGAQIEIQLSKQLAVFGIVRHCRRIGAKYRAGIRIVQAFYSSESYEHISGELVSRYLTRNGLSPDEMLHLRNHLRICAACCGRVNEAFTKKFQPSS